MTHQTSIVADLVALLNPNHREAYEERAGIMEFDGGLTRNLAECLALLEVLRVDPLALTGASLFRVHPAGFVLATDPAKLHSLGLRAAGPADLRELLQGLNGVARFSRISN